MIKYENIVNSDKVLENLKPQLLSFYEESYGSEFKEELEKRWNETIFILEGTPEDTKKLLSSIKDKKRKFQLLLEYIDYMRVKKRLESRMKDLFHKYYDEKIESIIGVSKEDLWNLDLYAIEDEDEERIRTYQIQCMNLGISPLANELKLSLALYRKEELYLEMQDELIRSTRWGRRIQEKIGFIPVEQLSEIIFEEELAASTTVVSNFFGECTTICFIPLARLMNAPSLDRIVLHELRHVVETKGKRSGLTNFEYPELDPINEIRTEKNAIKDESRLPIIFARTSNKKQSVYELVIPTIEELDIYEDYWNKVAMTGKIEDSEYEGLCNICARIIEETKSIQKKKKDH